MGTILEDVNPLNDLKPTHGVLSRGVIYRDAVRGGLSFFVGWYTAGLELVGS